MERLRITIIGQDIFKIVKEKCIAVGLDIINQVSTGMFGNIKTLTYIFELEDHEVINIRKRLMTAMQEDHMRLMPMYVGGDWMRIFVMKPIAE